MSKNGNRYTKEFKADAVGLVKEGRSAYSVASALGISPKTLRNWVGEVKKKPNPEKLRIIELKTELKAEKKRNAELEESLVILKKATAIFATDSRK